MYRFLLILVFSSSFVAGSQATPPEEAPIVRALPTETPPVIDGEVLNDEAWQPAEPARNFWQTAPVEGAPASEETEVRILYDSDNLYIGVLCYDSDPEGIIVSDSRRDASLENTDSFQIILDTYLDRQNGFVFGTNPAGLEYDGQVTQEGEGGGRGGRQQGGSGGGFNINWDGAWEVRAQTSRIGWSAEFRIPFKTLRYRGQTKQTWGLNFQRNIRRRNETAFWAPLSRQFSLFRLSEAGRLVAIEPPEQRNLKFIPYVLGEVRHIENQNGTNYLGDSGLDLKYNVAPSLTLDVTINTDFAQVEVDEQQVNLNRFNLFFPEKRPFFLENAGLFSVGEPGEVELFFSRRIGIGPNRGPIPILGGVRLSGRAGSAWNLGLLSMQTDEVDGITPGNNFSVIRISREFRNRSRLGGILVNRQASGDHSGLDEEFNRTFGIDGQLGIGEFGEVSGFLAGTRTPGVDSEQYAFKFGGSYDSPAWRLGANYSEVADNFNPEVGFLSRRGFRKIDLSIFHRYRPDWRGLQELRPHASYRGFWNFEGFQETGFLHIDNHWEFDSSAEIHTGMNLTREGVVEPFEISPGIIVPPGTYDHTEAQIVAFTNRGAPLSLELRTQLGGFFGGDRVNLEPGLNLRIGEAMSAEISWSRNDVTLPAGDFVTNLGRARISYSFSPRMFVQSLLQYNNQTGAWSSNLRFAWLQAANTGLFVVYNDTRAIQGFDISADRSLIIKFSRMFDLLN